MTPCLSVIISTFDRPEALALALAGVRGADPGAPGGLEVVVADDGSGPETRRVVEEFAAQAPFPVAHARHDHEGFRLAAIRNRAVRASSGAVLVFLDGDCIPEPGALARHGARCAPGRAHTGSRVFLDAEETARLLDGALAPAAVFGPARRRALQGLRRLYLQNLLHRALRLKPRPKLAAANCAVHRRDLERVNGFDERFVGWGFEDDDLARRLRRAGVRVEDGTRDCLAFHLFHKVHPSHRPSARGTPNDLYFRRGRFLTRCLRGLGARAIESLAIETLGSPPGEAEAWLRGFRNSCAPEGGAPEVSLRFSGSPARPRARGEVLLEVPPEVAAGGAEALRAYLERSL